MTKKIAVLLYLHKKKIALPYISLDLAHNLLNGRLWAPLL